jgi:hypothetical protein
MQFVVIPGYELTEVADVVRGTESWLVVRKRGEAAEYCRQDRSSALDFRGSYPSGLLPIIPTCGS